jgi:hypothetical protein
MEKKRQKRPVEGLGNFCIAAGFVIQLHSLLVKA